jgi:exodeoxyribonuclease V alpha subunit
MQRGELGARNLNAVLQQELNPSAPFLERFGVQYREGDKVMQLENDYDKDVFNGDIGRILRIREESREVEVSFDGRSVSYRAHELDELGLSYAVTIHKSQGSEYPCVIVPIHTQHFTMLRRNLLYTAVTRGKQLVILVGTRKALAIAVRTEDARRRQTTLRERVLEAFGRPSRPGPGT